MSKDSESESHHNMNNDTDFYKVPHPMAEQDAAPFYSWLFYSWVNPLLDRCAVRYNDKQEMLQSDTFHLPDYENPEKNAAILRENWKFELEKDIKDRSLIRALRKSFKKRIIIGGCFRFFSDCAAFSSPFVLQQFIKWLKSPNPVIWEGFVYVGLLVGLNLCMSWCLNASTHHTVTGFVRMVTSLPILIFDVIIGLPQDHGRTGHITALHANDAQRLLQLGLTFHSFWISPLIVFTAVAALYFFVGVAGIISVVFLIVTMPMQGFLMRKLTKYRDKIVKESDRRMGAINEALQGIRICKFMGWESRFNNLIDEIRSSEVSVLRSSYFLRAIVMFIAQALPAISIFGTFALAYAFDGTVAVENIFPALAMLNVIRIPLLFIPISIATIVESVIALRRIQGFLNEPVSKNYINVGDVQGEASVTNLTVYPKQKETKKEDVKSQIKPDLEMRTSKNNEEIDRPLISNVTCTFHKSKLTIVHGPTGCGKSTLLKAIMGESPHIAPESIVSVKGSVAYISQEAWIMNASIRSNICMGLPFDKEKYQSVVEACHLVDDFTQLKQGDSTEIGERGINLSGGQKQRISFARAAYSNREIVIMDDPLSAVDSHVCNGLFNDCIVKLMKNKTRILVTHQVQFLPQSDYIVEMLPNGEVFYAGPSDKGIPKLLKLSVSEDYNHTNGSIDDVSEGKVFDIKEIKGASLLTKENVNVLDVSWSVYQWYFKIGTVHWTVVTLLLYIIWRSAATISELWLAWWSTKVSVFGRSYTDLEYLTYFAITSMISITIVYFRQLSLAYFTVSASRKCHSLMLENVLRAPISFFDTTPMGRILNRFSKDIDSLDYRIPEILQTLLLMAFVLLGAMVLVIVSTPFVLLVIPMLLICLRHVYRRYMNAARHLKQIEAVTRSPVMAIVNETLGGLSTIRAYGMGRHFIHMHSDRACIAARAPYNQRCAQRWLSARTELFGSVVLLFTTYISALLNATRYQWEFSIQPGAIALAITSVLATTNSVTFLNRQLADFEAEMNSAERIKEYSSDIPQERDVVYDEETPAPPADWPNTGSIKFTNVSMRYRDDLDLVLNGVNIDIKSGEKVGLVGRTGSGKSSIILTMFRIVELAGGSISIDGINIANLSLHDLRRNITIIPQDPTLFTGTLRSNLDPFSEASDEDIWAVLDKCSMRLHVESLHEGLNSPVEERGANFSVGERQLLCLARALMKRSKILLLDEATASVDFEVDKVIQNTIATEFEACTVITIAHRLATIITGDKVVVMSDGIVAEAGSPKELLNMPDGQFKNMVANLGPEQAAELKTIADRK
eukprot:Tbor_TRINITY_DN5555_c2_g1::TRINITY_DN5555_c2_g1_i2::g.13278::m.13278/K05665/ABCC1; ATP-binding cassette, subfamily C (CFTR/MRP), member 1